MTPPSLPSAGNDPASSTPTSEQTIPNLVAEVFDEAPASDRRSLVEALMRPLGVLSLVAIANGIFAKIRFRNAGHDAQVRLDDIQNVRADDVAALVHHAQQVSVEAVDGLAQLLASSGGMASSAAATLLIALLVKRARSRSGSRPAAGDRLADAD